MPVTAGPVPGLTSGLHRVPMDPGRFRSGRWFILAEGTLVSAFGIAGLVSAALHPHAGPTGVPVLGLASTAAHSAILLGLGVVAIAAVGKRRAAVTITALSAVTYMMLLFFSAVATARTKPTPLGFHAADIVLHGVLGVVNLGLLMWLIPDELGDEVWAPRRRRGRGPDGRHPLASEAATEPAVAFPKAAAARTQEPGAHRSPRSPSQHPVVRGQRSPPGPTDPPASAAPEPSASLEQPGSQETHNLSAHNVERSTLSKHSAAQAADAVPSRGVMPMIVATLAAVVVVIMWMRRR